MLINISKTRSYHLMVTCVITLASAAALTAGAQELQRSTIALEEVVVTAERRAESLQNVPIAVSAFSADSLETKQISEPLDLITYVPNLTGARNTGVGTAITYYLRGLGNAESIATFDPPVGTYVNDVYVARQNANNVAFFDVEQIEVLRGPQGTLFGRNTTGGAINIRMRKPSDIVGGEIEAGVGSYGRRLLKATIDAPIADKLRTKISAFTIDEDGYVDNITTGETLSGTEAFGIRGDLSADIGIASWDVSFEYSEDDTFNTLNFEGPAGSVAVDPRGGEDRFSRTGISSSGTPGSLAELLAGRGLGGHSETTFVTSNLGIPLGGGSLSFITGYRNLEQLYTLDALDIPGVTNGSSGSFVLVNDGEHDQFSAELKYVSSYFDGKLDLISGLFYFKEENETQVADAFGGLVLANDFLINDLDSFAIYAQGDIHISDALTATLGLRWTDETKDVSITDLGVNPRLTDAGLDAAGVPRELQETKITPRFALNYNFSDDMSVFVSATNGFKSGGWNARSNSPATFLDFGSEEAWNYELGLRSTFWQDRARLNITAFFLDVEGFQTSTAFFAAGALTPTFLVRNGVDMENQGIEIDLELLLSEGLTAFAAIGIQDATLKNPSPGFQAQIDDCIASPTNAGGGAGTVTVDCQLADPVRAPDFTGAIGIAYNIPLPNPGITITPSLNVAYSSSYFVATNNLPFAETGSYTTVNAGIAMETDDGLWRLSLSCSNCTDEAYRTVTFSPSSNQLNDPVRWSIQLRRAF